MSSRAFPEVIRVVERAIMNMDSSVSQAGNQME